MMQELPSKKSEEKRKMTCIEELDLSVRSYNCLKRAGISTVEQLAGMTQEEMMHIRNLGSKSYEEISRKVKGWRPVSRSRRLSESERDQVKVRQGIMSDYLPGDQVIVHAEVLQSPRGGSALYKLKGSDNISFFVKGKDLELDVRQASN